MRKCASSINPKICPFCKKENLCEAHIPNNNCWCNTIQVPKDLRVLKEIDGTKGWVNYE